MAKGDQLAKLDAFGIEAFCEKIMGGESQTFIAREIGVSPGTLINWLASDPDRSARAREARIAAARSYDDMAEEELRKAEDPFSLAKARELASHFRWKASKADPRVYGEKLAVDQNVKFYDLTEEQIDAKLAALNAKL